MARLEVNRSGEMEVFVRVVEQEGFSAAARTLRMTPSAVSKLVARLEARMGARLIHRNTRDFQLTSEGCVFYERSVEACRCSRKWRPLSAVSRRMTRPQVACA
ncbi:LysR family transcriptional regulator [Corallococcus interemptor]|uniref:LysR family transcriptional regulator n=1 Tax=Corallococcus interemptor TaxID=2316720 RepID=UPI0035D45F88